MDLLWKLLWIWGNIGGGTHIILGADQQDQLLHEEKEAKVEFQVCFGAKDLLRTAFSLIVGVYS